jgi:hypothetical protein
MLRRALLLLGLLMGPQIVAAQAPEAKAIETGPPVDASVRLGGVAEIPDGAEVQSLTSGARAIVRRQQGGEVRLALRSLDDRSSVPLPFTDATISHGPDYEIDASGRYVAFCNHESSTLTVFDRQTGRAQRFTHPRTGTVGRLSVAAETGDVMYDVAAPQFETRKVFLWTQGSDQPTLIAEDVGPLLSPDGELALIAKPRSAVESESAIGWYVFDRRGNELLDLSRYGFPGYADWGPDSQKIAFEPVTRRRGFYIAYLSQNGTLRLNRTRYVGPPEGQFYSAPRWSPEGSKIAYTVEYAGDQSLARMRLHVLEDSTYRQFDLGPTPRIGPRPWGWASPQALYLDADSSPKQPPNRDLKGDLVKLIVDF